MWERSAVAALGLALGVAGCGESSEEQGPGVDASAVEGQRVFVTSATQPGDFGGLEGADGLCMAHAADAGLDGTFLAWLSTSEAPAAERMTHADGPYVRVDGVRVAADWEGLVSGGLEAPINLDANGVARTGDVWTGTLVDGSSYDLGDCEAWTTGASPAVSLCGRSTSSGAQWTDNQQVACSVALRLYCFEQ
jgi:hypothetical protein